MRYKQSVINEVRELRRLDGLSLGRIQKLTNIPKTTIHKWIKDTQLTPAQQESIRKESLLLLQEGRIKAQKINRKKRTDNEKVLFDKGKIDIGKLSQRDFFIAGIALYWAEGFKNKHEHRLGFCNSDPNMIKFYLAWLRDLGVTEQRFVARLSLNSSYKDKNEEIQAYWSKFTRIPLRQFTKSFYQNTQWKKQYTDENYKGVLRIHVKDSLDILLQMKGWIEGLKENSPG
jgi:hypothetical protein